MQWSGSGLKPQGAAHLVSSEGSLKLLVAFNFVLPGHVYFSVCFSSWIPSCSTPSIFPSLCGTGKPWTALGTVSSPPREWDSSEDSSFDAQRAQMLR